MKYSVRLIACSLSLLWGCSGSPDGATAQTGHTEQAKGGTDVSRAALQAAAGNGAAQAFYQRRDWRAAWSQDAADALRQALGERARDGLDRVTFLGSLPQSPAERDVALTRAAIAYASALSRGLLEPEAHYDVYTLPRPATDLAAGLNKALDDGQLKDWLAGLAPQDAHYEALSRAYLRLEKASRDQHDQEVPAGGLIHEGDHDPRVPQIATALVRAGYLDQADTSGELYGSRLADAVRRLQEDRGIKADGIVGAQTLKALNTGADDRARAAAVALERRRWLRRDPPATRIDVNTASAMLTYYRNGTVVDERKVIVGQPGWKTPQLQTQMFRLVANPTWTVPKSIERKQIGSVGPGYLRSHNMVWRNGWLVQRSGPDNALGLVKFDLKDRYAIYLHDTPSKSLFDRSQRQLSHGCIRVHHALDFAQMLAADEDITREWQQARAKRKQAFVPLPDPITVRLLYHPTFVAQDGQVVFQQDIYDRNGWIAGKLGFGDHKGRRITPGVEDLGP